MRELSDDFKLSVRSIAEVFAVLNDLDSRFGRSRRVTFRGKRLTREALVNAAVVYLGSLPEPMQAAALTGSVARIEGFLAGSEADAASSGKAAPTIAVRDTSAATRRDERKRRSGVESKPDTDGVEPDDVPPVRRKR